MRSAILVTSLAGLVAGSKCRPQKDFKYLVTFGDSYSDDGRLNYYGTHEGEAPPAGTLQEEQSKTASGGLTWPQFVANYTGAANYDYALSGATCSNEIISRYLGFVDGPFPSVMDDAIPSFESDFDTELYADVTADNAVYALWIGTNDLGTDAFLTDSQAPGTNLTTFVECLWNTFDRIYAKGGRRFVLFNQNALQLAPMYQPPYVGLDQVGDNEYWKNKTEYNATEYSFKMMEYTTTLNTVVDYGVPYHLLVKSRWPGASFAVYDVHGLVTEIYNNPKSYLEPPYNVNGSYRFCDGDGNCEVSDGPLNGYLWFDELHPSNKTDTYIAEEFIKVVAGTSKYGTYWGY